MSRHLFYFAAFCLIAFARWLGHTFGDPSIDQILYHLHYSERAAIEMSEIFVLTMVAEVLALPAAATLVVTLLHGAAARSLPARARIVEAVPRVALVAGISVLLLQLSAFSYAAAYFAADRFGQQYVDPAGVRLEAGKLRNLVLIYAESLEETYGDPGRFGNDLLAPLRAVGGESFPSYRQAPGASWTIAGMVATQCGAPLRIGSPHDIKRTGNERAFMPGAVCLGDLLESRGYRNVFMGGAYLSFAGKGAFLRDHGYKETYGLDEWKLAGVDPKTQNAWGLYDSELFARARARLQTLHASGQPFNLTLLTLDTHHPDGFMSPHCRDRGANGFEGIVRCAGHQLADFIGFMREKGYLEDTVVVILGDHLAMPNPVIEQLERGERRIFNLYLTPDKVSRNTQELLPFDMFPTIAELVGLTVVGDRLGLGYSGVAGADVARPANRVNSLDFQSLGGSAAYRRLWQR